MNKMVINHLDKLFVTSDAATIIRELEVAHPAANLLVMAAHMQDQEVRLRAWAARASGGRESARCGPRDWRGCGAALPQSGGQ
jgi:hypothetical protein